MNCRSAREQISRLKDVVLLSLELARTMVFSMRTIKIPAVAKHDLVGAGMCFTQARNANVIRVNELELFHEYVTGLQIQSIFQTPACTERQFLAVMYAQVVIDGHWCACHVKHHQVIFPDVI